MTLRLLCVLAFLAGSTLPAQSTLAPEAAAVSAPPVLLDVWDDLRCWNTPTSISEGPTGFAFAPDGSVLVTFPDACVQARAPDGTLTSEWGDQDAYGARPGRFDHPAGIAVGPSGDSYVIDRRDRVQRFDATGTFVSAWGSTGAGNGQFDGPAGIAVGPSGDVYVTDSRNDRVQRFTSTGVFVSTWGISGMGNGQFDSPVGIAVAASGDVYVADFGNDRVQRFTSTGTFVATWGTYGSGNGQFSGPAGVAIGPGGAVYVTDSGLYTGIGRVEQFTADGAFVAAWGTSETDEPAAIGVAPTGEIYITYWPLDYAEDPRVQVFAPSNRVLTVTASVAERRVLTGEVLHHRITLTNTGAATLTGIAISAPRAPGCAGSRPALAPGARQFVECSYTTTAGDAGTRTSTFFVDTAQTEVVASNPVIAAVVVATEQRRPLTFDTKWGYWGEGPGGFVVAEGVAVGPAGHVYVTDTSTGQSRTDRVQEFTADGQLVRATGTPLTWHPTGVAAGPDGTLYVTDTQSDRVRRFSASLAPLGGWGGPGTGNGRFDDANGVATDAAGNVYVADTHNHRVQKFTSTGTYLGQWGSDGFDAGEFHGPMAVATDAAGNVYVVEEWGDRVQVFTGSGAFLRQWGGAGTGPGRFHGTAGVAVADGVVYVADRGNYRMQAFTTSGSFLASWGSQGERAGHFVGAIGVAASASGRVYVVESDEYIVTRVQVFGRVARPDGRIRKDTTVPYRGDDIYNTSAVGQTRSAAVARGSSATYWVSVQNDAGFPDALRLRGTASTSRFTVRYTAGGGSITGAVTAGTYTTPVLLPGESFPIKVTVTVGASAPAGASLRGTLVAKSGQDGTRKDTVAFTTSRA